MGRTLGLLALAAAPMLASAPAMADQRPAGGQEPGITVEGDRIICRRVTRTATRMGTGSRVCRSQAQWRNNAAHSSSPTSENSDISDASDTLEILGEKISTNGGAGANTGGAGPY